MSSAATCWYDVYGKPPILTKVTTGIKKDHTPHYLYLLFKNK